MLEGDQLVGIITETDVFKVLTEVLGAREPGLRITLGVKDAKGVLARITDVLAKLGANISALVAYSGRQPGERFLMVKLSDVDAAAVKDALAGLDVQVVDFRGQ